MVVPAQVGTLGWGSRAILSSRLRSDSAAHGAATRVTPNSTALVVRRRVGSVGFWATEEGSEGNRVPPRDFSRFLSIFLVVLISIQIDIGAGLADQVGDRCNRSLIHWHWRRVYMRLECFIIIPRGGVFDIQLSEMLFKQGTFVFQGVFHSLLVQRSLCSSII